MLSGARTRWRSRWSQDNAEDLKPEQAQGRKMETNSTDFRVKEGDKVDLHDWPTEVDPVYNSKKAYKKLLRKHVAQLSSLQQLLYASNRYALLIIFQGKCSGKR
jgi:polyphosphate kinase 2 (PPK2 family)